jgi:glucokinase
MGSEMGRLAIGVDLGGTQLRAALIDQNGTLLVRTAMATAATQGPEVVADQIRDAVATVSAGIDPPRLIGVGVCSPGPLDSLQGIVLNVATLTGFVNIPFRRMLQERIGMPVWLENDGIAAALGEWRYGAGQSVSNLVYITVSTGIGGGVVADGRLLRGRRGMAGHIGHMSIVRDGDRCDCGNPGCWEEYASGTRFARRARQRVQSDATTTLGKGDSPVDGRAVFAAATAGDPLAKSLVAEEADLLGAGIVNLLHLYSPELVIMGGGMSANFAQLHPGIAARIATCAMPPFRDTPVVRAVLGDNSGLVGAAATAFEAAKP